VENQTSERGNIMSLIINNLDPEPDHYYWEEKELDIEPLDPTLWLEATFTTGKIVAGLALVVILWGSL
jgi:hypothetical protein